MDRASGLQPRPMANAIVCMSESNVGGPGHPGDSRDYRDPSLQYCSESSAMLDKTLETQLLERG